MKRALVLALIALGLVYVLVRDVRHKLSERFSFTIRAESATYCLKRTPCIVTLEQFLPGDWDRIIVFAPGASQKDITEAVGPNVKKVDLSRLVVFLKGSKVLRTVVEQPDVEAPDYHIVEFTGVAATEEHLTLHRGQRYVRAKGDPCDNCLTLRAINPGDGAGK